MPTRHAHPVPAEPLPAHPRGPSRPAVSGVLTMAPLVLAYAPFALVIGSTVATVDEPLAAWAGSWLIYGGSAHLAALHALADGGPVLAVVTGLLVHTRLLVYGAAMAPRWRDQPRWFRLLAPALLIDPTWALAERDATSSGPAAHRRFFLGAALTLGLGWSLLIAAGALAGSRLPHAGLDLAAPLCLLALVGPRLRDRAHRWAAAAAAGVAVAGARWPAGLGVGAAIVAGVVVALIAGRAGRRAIPDGAPE